MTGFDISEIKSHSGLRLAINKMVVAEVIQSYTLLDKILGELILAYFLQVQPDAPRFPNQSASSAVTIPSEVLDTVRKVNAVRNALAHSFFPELRKEYKKVQA
jgi:hypothetical protein